MPRALAPPVLKFCVRVGHREDGIGRKPVGEREAEVRGERHGVDLLMVVTVGKLVEDIVVVLAAIAQLALIVVILTVVLIDWQCARCRISIVERRYLVLIVAAALMIAVEGERGREELREGVVEVQRPGVSLVGVRLDDVLFIVVSHGGIVARHLRATTDTGSMLCAQGIVAEQFEPVGVTGLIGRHTLQELIIGDGTVVEVLHVFLIAHCRHAVRELVVVLNELARELHALLGVHDINGMVCIARTHLIVHGEVVAHDGLALVASLRGDDDDTVGGLRTIDGCGSSVFQDIDALDVLRVDTGNGITDTVDIVGVVEFLR